MVPRAPPRGALLRPVGPYGPDRSSFDVPIHAVGRMASAKPSPHVRMSVVDPLASRLDRNPHIARSGITAVHGMDRLPTYLQSSYGDSSFARRVTTRTLHLRVSGSAR